MSYLNPDHENMCMDKIYITIVSLSLFYFKICLIGCEGKYMTYPTTCMVCYACYSMTIIQIAVLFLKKIGIF